MPAVQPIIRIALLLAIALNLLALPAQAAPVDCEHIVALARVVTKEARVNFVAGHGERTPTCPSAARACQQNAYVVPGDEVLVGATDGRYVCALFKSQQAIETTGWLPRTALEVVSPRAAPARQWDGTWRRDRDAQIVLKSHDDDVAAAGDATWGGHDPQRVRRGGVHVGVLNGKGRPRGQTLAIGYDPDRSGFPPAQDETPDGCAAKLELLGRYLMVEDNGMCGGLNVSFTGIYVRTK